MTGRYPDLETAAVIIEVLGLHVRDAGALASAVERPLQVVWGSEAYPGLHLKAAVLLDGINRSHPLIDGNKRLSFLMVARLYDMHGYRMPEDPDVNDRFIRRVADEHPDLEVVATWLESRVVRVP